VDPVVASRILSLTEETSQFILALRVINDVTADGKATMNGKIVRRHAAAAKAVGFVPDPSDSDSQVLHNSLLTTTSPGSACGRVLYHAGMPYARRSLSHIHVALQFFDANGTRWTDGSELAGDD
jgi:hypothetical protein